MQDYEGMKFGKWKVLYKDKNNNTKDIRWICQCECGNIKSVLGKYLKNGKSLSCGCDKRKDLTGQTFGKLLVLETLYNYNGYNKATYKCQCECGNIVYVKSTSIYKTASCGCSRKLNIIGQKFGKLLVKSMNYDNKEAYCECLCDCGKKVFTRANALLTGNTKSCGCIHSPSLINNVYGKLIVVDEYYENNLKHCICKCQCGNVVTLLGRSLTSGNTTSCGCYRSDLHSKNEQLISNFLKDNKVEFYNEKTFDDCVGIGNKKLRFDFYIPNINTVIEYDGKQHFEPIDYFGGESSFNIQKENDKIKNQYCKDNNIRLVRISYKNKIDNIYNILNNIIFSNPVTTTVI